MRGFTDYSIEYVIKFGGSIIENPEVCKKALNKLEDLIQDGHRMLVVPGGGPTDLTIERLNERYNFNPDTHHRACAKAQDQTGLMLEGLSSSEKSVACEDLNAVLESLSNKKLPILMPSRIIFDIEPFERTWVITSDSMAAWFAWLVHCKNWN